MRIGLRIRHIDNPDTLGVITWISKTTMRVPWFKNKHDRTIVVVWDKKPNHHKKKDRYWLHQLECVTLAFIQQEET